MYQINQVLRKFLTSNPDILLIVCIKSDKLKFT